VGTGDAAGGLNAEIRRSGFVNADWKDSVDEAWG